MQLSTVKIQDGKDDYIVINESDFDEGKHKLFVEKEEKPKKPKNDKNPEDDKNPEAEK